jgi:membrane protein YqaA with SNARE-associated domain
MARRAREAGKKMDGVNRDVQPAGLSRAESPAPRDAEPGRRSRRVVSADPSAAAPSPRSSDQRRGPRRAGSVVRRFIRRLLDRLRGWAESGWAGPALLTWGIMQSSVVPGPTDGLLIPLALSHPRRTWRFVLWAIAGSVLGGLIAFLIGRFCFDEVGRPLLNWVGVGDGRLGAARGLFQRWGWLLVAGVALFPLSTKAVSILAGAFGVPVLVFAAALAAGRVARFSIDALALRYGGERFERWLRKKLATPEDE